MRGGEGGVPSYTPSYERDLLQLFIQTSPPWPRSVQAAASTQGRDTHLDGPRVDVLLVVLQQREKALGVPVQVPHPGCLVVVATGVVVDVVVVRDAAAARERVAARSELRPREGASCF